MTPSGTCCSGLWKFEKILFTIISIAAFGALAYEWILVIRCYLDSPIRSTVLYKEPKRMHFPSLLFCQRYFYLNESQIGGNLNDQPSHNVVKYMRIVTNPVLDVAATLGPNGGIFSSEQEQNKAQADYLSYVGKFNNNPWAAFERIMLNCHETIRQCSLGGQNFSSSACCQQWIVRRLTPIGPCLAVQPPDQEIPSSNGAFQIDIDLANSAFNFAPNFVGFDLYLGDMIGKPMIPSLSLMDEDSYTVQLTSTTYENNIDHECNRRLVSTFGQFDFVGMDHAMRCTAHAVKKLCQCDPVYKVQLDAVTSISEWPYRSTAVAGIDSGSTYQVRQGAYQFCDLNNVIKCAAPLLNTTRDPANFTRQAQRLLGSIPCDTRPPCVDHRYHFAVTEFREMAPMSNYRCRLRLYYESFVTTEIQQIQSLNFHDVIMNLGGAVAFWFVAVHILMYILTAIKYCLNCGKHTRVNGVSKNRVADIEAASMSNGRYANSKSGHKRPNEQNGDRVNEIK